MLLSAIWVAVWAMLGAAAMDSSGGDAVRCIMYLTGQHDVVPPSADLITDITHVILAFMRSDIFNAHASDQPPRDFPLFTSVDKVRSRFQPNTKIMVAIGGWGDSQGFEDAARNVESRKQWAGRVREMVNLTGADGVDIDWEYPGGNRDDYKVLPNDQRHWEIDAFVELLRELRVALGSERTLSIAVPGIERDLLAFNSSTVPIIADQVNFINVMTYDLMNRRDAAVKHHSGVQGSRASIQQYIDRGAPPHKLNLGLGYYVKWYMTQANCNPEQPLGCPTQLLEDTDTGADLGGTAAFSWHDEIPSELAASFARARAEGRYHDDGDDGGYGYWDAAEQRWWSFDTPEVIAERKLPQIVGPMGLGGVFAWGLGEDAHDFKHLKATIDGVRALKQEREGGRVGRDEL